MTEFSLTGTLNCASLHDAGIVAAHVGDHIRLSRAEPGCLAFDITPTADPLVWQIAERFVDRAAFDIHQTRTRASQWFRATGHIPRVFRD